ncbi:hypothetical protein CBC_A0212 [Clostridium botulinum C str. Eklund]|nr:hypothetical protein CBC_A0212 [Clostridium botulinum C str. Eklund]NEZ49688.1 hypothetical protein [Clostridium botulinum]
MIKNKHKEIAVFILIISFIIVVAVGLSPEKRKKFLFYICIGAIFYIIITFLSLIKRKFF